MNIDLSKLTALSVTFYAEPLTILRFAGTTKVGGEYVNNDREEVEIQAVIRAGNQETVKRNFSQLEFTEGMVQVHSVSQMFAQDGISRNSADEFMIDDNLFVIVAIDNSMVHGGFYKALATKKQRGLMS